MPNWYTTQIIAKGSDADLDRIVATHIVPAEEGDRKYVGDQVFEFATVIPIPETIKNTPQANAWYNANWSGEAWTKDLLVLREKPGELVL